MTPTHVSPGVVPLDLRFAQKQTPDKDGGISSLLRKTETQEGGEGSKSRDHGIKPETLRGRELLLQGNLETLYGHLCPPGQ